MNRVNDVSENRVRDFGRHPVGVRGAGCGVRGAGCGVREDGTADPERRQLERYAGSRETAGGE